MSYRNTNTDKPKVGGVHSVNQPKLPEWIEDIVDVGGDIIDAGKDITEFLNGQDDKTTVGDLEDSGGTKNAEGNDWVWWNPLSWNKWPWESADESEGGTVGVTTKWIVIGVLGILIYVLVKGFTKKASW